MSHQGTFIDVLTWNWFSANSLKSLMIIRDTMVSWSSFVICSIAESDLFWIKVIALFILNWTTLKYFTFLNIVQEFRRVAGSGYDIYHKVTSLESILRVDFPSIIIIWNGLCVKAYKRQYNITLLSYIQGIAWWLISLIGFSIVSFLEGGCLISFLFFKKGNAFQTGGLVSLASISVS